MKDGTVTIAIPLLNDEKHKNYFDALEYLGARGVQVDGACDPGDFDGLLLPGGGDLNPALYGAVKCAECGVPDDALDALQMAAMGAFVKARKPVLGICRGHQLINVYFGGTLIQHLPDCACHRKAAGSGDEVHAVHARKGTALERMYGCDFCTNSSHHQAIDRLGEGLEIVARSEDGVAEAVRHRTLPVCGVQWHPERMGFAHARRDTVDGAKMIQWFLDRCKEWEA